MKLFLLIFCLFPLIVSAQIGQLEIKADYDSIPFTEFATELEQNEDLHFFFKKTWVDTIVVKQNRIPLTLEQLLNDTFKGSYLNSYFDGSNIIVTNKYPIHTTLPDDFFAAKKKSSGRVVRSEEHTSELQSRPHLVCRLLLEKKKKKKKIL